MSWLGMSIPCLERPDTFQSMILPRIFIYATRWRLLHRLYRRINLIPERALHSVRTTPVTHAPRAEWLHLIEAIIEAQPHQSCVSASCAPTLQRELPSMAPAWGSTEDARRCVVRKALRVPDGSTAVAQGTVPAHQGVNDVNTQAPWFGSARTGLSALALSARLRLCRTYPYPPLPVLKQDTALCRACRGSVQHSKACLALPWRRCPGPGSQASRTSRTWDPPKFKRPGLTASFLKHRM